MSRPEPESQRLVAEDFEFHDEEDDTPDSRPFGIAAGASIGATGMGPTPSRSHYHLPASEQLRGMANRIIFSRYYILFYFVMMSLSLTTVVLSLLSKDGCPPLSWHILEVIINALMVVEVGTRWVAYGKKYPLTPLNILDLALVLFCSITLILVFNSPCSDGVRSEENLDLILLVIRNAVQFLRLFNVLRRSGHSLLNPPKPIDLSQARTASLVLDLDLDLDDEEAVAERQLAGARPLASSEWSVGVPGASGRRTLLGGGGRRGYEPIFSDDPDRDAGQGQRGEVRKPLDVRDSAGREGLSAEDDDAWDRLG